MKTTVAEARTTVATSPDMAFAHIVPIDLSSIFTGYGPLPAVIGTRDQTGPWDATGQTRTVMLSDGSEAHESLTAYRYPHYFAYTVGDFTGILRLLAREAHGGWWFECAPDKRSTTIRWRYAFVSKSAIVEPILCAITRWLWSGYMRKALALSKAGVERAARLSK